MSTQNTWRRFVACLFALMLGLCSAFTVSADNGEIDWDTAYGYNYDLDGHSIQTPAYYEVNAESPSAYIGAVDMVLDGGLLYLLYPAHSKVAVVDLQTLQTIREIKTEGVDLSDARGLYITSDHKLYVSLYEQKKILVMNLEGTLLQMLEEPKSDAITDNFEYKPTRLVVQEDFQSGRRLIYVVSEGAYDGLVQLDENGEFISFWGGNTVQLTMSQMLTQFWSAVFTNAMKERTALALPANYSSVTLSPDGFIYTCTNSSDVKEGQIKRLSPYGTDITNTAGNKIYGDLESAVVNGSKTTNAFVDITVDKNGFVTVLDAKMGKVFQYDRESHLLGVFGGLGNQRGLFQDPVALVNDGAHLYVLDSGNGRIYRYIPTAYGSKIQQAILLSQEGNEAEAKVLFKEIYQQCGKLAWVNRALGKAALIEEDYITGMQFFEAAGDVENYSECFESYRSTLMEKYFGILFLAVILLLAVAWFAISHSMKKAEVPAVDYSKKRITPLRLLNHPTSFGAMKEEKRGSLWMACGVLVFVVITRLISLSSTGFIFDPADDTAINYPLEAFQVILLFFCFVACSWAVGTFLEGKGQFKELLIAAAYALLPYCACSLLSTGLSNVLCLREGAFVTGLQMIGMCWSVLLMFIAMMQTNQYSFGKTVGSLLFTVLAMVFVLFIMIMMFTLVSKMTGFVGQLLEEYQYKYR